MVCLIINWSNYQSKVLKTSIGKIYFITLNLHFNLVGVTRNIFCIVCYPFTINYYFMSNKLWLEVNLQINMKPESFVSTNFLECS